MRYRVLVATHAGATVKATVHCPGTVGVIPHLEPVELGALRVAAVGRIFLAEFDADSNAVAGALLEAAIRPEDPRVVKGLGNLGACIAGPSAPYF